MSSTSGPRPRIQIVTSAEGACVWITEPGQPVRQIEMTADHLFRLGANAIDAALHVQAIARHARDTEPAPPHFLDAIDG